jgi:hypothetical protein
MASFTHPVIPKRTIAPLFEFSSSIRGVHDLGGTITLRGTEHEAIRKAMDANLGRLRERPERFETYLSPQEREKFEAARCCLEHRFEAPDYVGESEQRSKEEIQAVVIAMRVVKPTRAKPGLYLGWENRNNGWELRGFEKVGFDAYTAPEEPLRPFSAADAGSLAELMPRVRQAYSAHGRGRFNRVANALNFFETGYRSNWDVVRFVVFTTALESLFITSDKMVSRQFRERIARFLAQNPANRRKLEDTCRAIYDARSAIVHGQPLAAQGGVDQLMLEVQQIGRRCLQRVLGDGVLFATFCGPAPTLGRFLDQTGPRDGLRVKRENG